MNTISKKVKIVTDITGFILGVSQTKAWRELEAVCRRALKGGGVRESERVSYGRLSHCSDKLPF